MKSKQVLVESISMAGNGTKSFTYEANPEDDVSVGDIFNIDFANKQTLGIIRKIITEPVVQKYKIKKLGKKVPLPTPLPKYFLELADWTIEYYASSPKAVYSMMLPGGLKSKAQLKLTETQVSITPISKLNTDQTKALKIINENKTTLLHGITGSGKTEIYLHAIDKFYKSNKSTILLVPEIMLTTQLEDKVRKHFKNVLVLHSGLSAALRKKIWLEALGRSELEPLIIIGPRSALFTPLHNLGLIIIDEEHEPSYKQESGPRYEAQIVAAKLRSLTNSKLILGSATPSLRTFYLSKSKRIAKAELKNRHQSTLPETIIVDTKKAKNIISEELFEQINKTLKNNKQVLLFLNRRGSASAMLCNNCGETVKCPNCSISLTYHADLGRLVCHYCNYKTSPQATCSICKSSDMRFVGDGTKKLEAEVRMLWPEARVARIDGDNSNWSYLKSTHEELQDSKIDILLGTQMISRGLDIANLNLVGIIDANSTLQIPDYTSSERAYQLISQAAGRAGRRSEKGTVVVQTITPENPTVVAATNNDFETFYKNETKSRKDFIYPPFCYLLKLEYAHKNPKVAKSNAEKLLNDLKKESGINILGPVIKTRKSLARENVVQIIIKSRGREKLVDISKSLPNKWTHDLDPINLI